MGKVSASTHNAQSVVDDEIIQVGISTTTPARWAALIGQVDQVQGGDTECVSRPILLFLSIGWLCYSRSLCQKRLASKRFMNLKNRIYQKCFFISAVSNHFIDMDLKYLYHFQESQRFVELKVKTKYK